MSFITSLNVHGRFIEIIKRFPVVIFFAVVTTFSLIWIIDNNVGDSFKWPVCGFIGFMAMLDWTIGKEAYRLSVRLYWIGVLMIMILLGFYYYMIPSDFEEKPTCFWFFTIGLSICLHLILCLIPYIKTKNNAAFTTFNVSLLIAWIQSALYSFIFYIALSLAILALDKLFDIKLEYMVYFKLFILVTGLIQSLFFLSEIPNDFFNTELPATRSIFKIITSFVFIPITFLYGIILYAYMVRVALTEHILVEWTFVMVIWYFVVGLLAWLFAGYYDNEGDNNLLAFFRKWFFRISLLPLCLLFISLYRNIEISGITTDFYLVAMLAFSLGLILIYLIVNPSGADKRMIPFIFLLFTILSFMGGPVSVCTLPVTNQQKQLIRQLTDIGIIKENKIVIDTSQNYPDSNGIISRNLYYLESMGALGFITQFDGDHLIKTPADSLSSYELTELFRLNRYNKSANDEFWDAYFTIQATVNLTGYDRMIPQKNEIGEFSSTDFLLIDSKGQGRLFIGGTEIGSVSMKNDLYQLSLRPDSSPVLEYSIQSYKIKLVVESANGENKNGEIKISAVRGLVFLGQNINN